MKKLLAVGLTLALVFGVVSGASAFDGRFVAVSGSDLQVIEDNTGGLAPKDACVIWMDNFNGWVGIWDFAPDPVEGCFFSMLEDPELGYMECLPPYFTYKVDVLQFGAHTYYAVDTLLITLEFSISEPVPSAHPCGYEPGGAPIYVGYSSFLLPPGTLAFLTHYVVPGTDWCAWVDGPFLVTVKVVDTGGSIDFGFLTDYNALPFYDCTHWLWGECVAYPMWLEFSEIGIDGNNLMIGAHGRPAWNVAVDMGSFEAVPGNGQVTLNWQSMSETNNQYWIVNRDGEEIARLDGQGNKETRTDYTYVDLTNGVVYSYSLEAVNAEGNHDEYGPITATPMAAGIPGEFALSQNYPNPFNASTVIRYQLASDEHVSLKVYNISGQEVASLVNADQKAGQYTVQWNGKEVSSGVYLYTLTAGEFSQTNKMVFTK